MRDISMERVNNLIEQCCKKDPKERIDDKTNKVTCVKTVQC